jgi:hypothetical protein
MKLPKDRNDRVMALAGPGLAEVLEVAGPDNPDVYKDYDSAKSAKSVSH